MWIKIKKTFNLDHAQFFKGELRDVAESLIKKLPKGSYEQTVAPWEQQVDQDQKQIAAARQTFLKLQSAAIRSRDIALTAKGQAAEAEKTYKSLQDNSDLQRIIATGKKAAQVLKDKSAGEKAKATARRRVRDMEYLYCKLAHAEATHQAARHLAALKYMEAQDKAATANAVKAGLDELTNPKTKTPNPEPESNEPEPKTETGPEDTDSSLQTKDSGLQNDDNTAGQTTETAVPNKVNE